MVTRIVLILAALVLAGCGGNDAATAPTGEEPAGVVAALYPLAFAAERVAGADADVSNLTPPGAEPHDVELSARDVGRIREADVVLYLGGGFQPALEQALTGAKGRAVDLLEGLELREEGEAGRLDPHVWLDPLRYATIVERIGTELVAEEQAAAVVAELEALHAEYEEGLGDCARRRLVTSHAAFGYLADRYDLEQVAIAGLSPEAEPSAQDLERLVAEVRGYGATTVFSETLTSPRVAETIAREAGARTATLNPLEGLTGEELAGGADYFSVMRANLETLREGLGCR